MSKARRLKAERATRQTEDSTPGLEPEYPSLSPADIAEGASVRLAKSRRKFEGSRAIATDCSVFIEQAIGVFGAFDHASTSLIDAWLAAWRMPNDSEAVSDVNTSAAVFVGVKISSGMPETSPLHKGPPFITLTSHFIETCHRLSELFPVFAALVGKNTSAADAAGMRDLIFDHLGSAPTSSEGSELIEHGRDELFSSRTTAAAARWAIAHEMAHAVGTKADREAAYAEAATLWPDLERDQWHHLRDKVPDFKASVPKYRDEIACDLLANEYVLASPFSTDDLMTQISGSLLALLALVWDGWQQDESAISRTHPSPTLRFRLIWKAWLSKLTDSETWSDRERPGIFGLQDFAYWFAFENWFVGAYSQDRKGAVWAEDIDVVLSVLNDHGPSPSIERIYARTPDGVFRVPTSRGE